MEHTSTTWARTRVRNFRSKGKETVMGNTVHITSNDTLSQVEYDIEVGVDDGSEPVVVAKCWDYALAEALKKSVEDYMGL